MIGSVLGDPLGLFDPTQNSSACYNQLLNQQAYQGWPPGRTDEDRRREAGHLHAARMSIEAEHRKKKLLLLKGEEP